MTCVTIVLTKIKAEVCNFSTLSVTKQNFRNDDFPFSIGQTNR